MGKKEAEKPEEPEFKNVVVGFVDDPNKHQITLPLGMELDTAMNWLAEIKAQSERTFQFRHRFVGWFPLDAMWAAYRALAEVHGFVKIDTIPGSGWFDPDQPPSMINIEIAYGKRTQMPWGAINVSGFSGTLMPAIVLHQGVPTLEFVAGIKNNEREKADLVMARAEEMLKTSSIYRGKAVEFDFEVVSPRDFTFDPTKAPKFWDVRGISKEDIILPDAVRRQVQTSMWTPIEKTALCREHKIPLRRGVLLAGGYGVGKTLAARVTAALCEDYGWTFLYLRKLEQLPQALKFAKFYEPCVIFAEDVNRVVSGDRTKAMDELFNTIDGVDRKNDEVMVVFTTNELDEIHAGMLRPGRIDSVITVTPPDAFAAEKLMRLYGRDLIAATDDISKPAKLMTGQIPAIIREVVERSKLTAIIDAEPGVHLRVRSAHLEVAAEQMLLHAELLKEPDEELPDLEVLGNAIGAVLVNGMKQYVYDNTDLDHDDLNDMKSSEINERGVRAILDETGRPNDNGHAKHVTE